MARMPRRPAIFAVAEGIEHSKEHIELFFGSEFESGYGWIFPRDGVEVNIGFVLGKEVVHKVPLRQKLLDFIARDYPKAKVKILSLLQYIRRFAKSFWILLIVITPRQPSRRCTVA